MKLGFVCEAKFDRVVDSAKPSRDLPIRHQPGELADKRYRLIGNPMVRHGTASMTAPFLRPAIASRAARKMRF